MENHEEFCEKCGGRLENGQKYCPFCRKEVEAINSKRNAQLENDSKRDIGMAIFTLIVGVLCILMLIAPYIM